MAPAPTATPGVGWGEAGCPGPGCGGVGCGGVGSRTPVPVAPAPRVQGPPPHPSLPGRSRGRPSRGPWAGRSAATPSPAPGAPHGLPCSAGPPWWRRSAFAPPPPLQSGRRAQGPPLRHVTLEGGRGPVGARGRRPRSRPRPAPLASVGWETAERGTPPTARGPRGPIRRRRWWWRAGPQGCTAPPAVGLWPAVWLRVGRWPSLGLFCHREGREMASSLVASKIKLRNFTAASKACRSMSRLATAQTARLSTVLDVWGIPVPDTA